MLALAEWLRTMKGTKPIPSLKWILLGVLVALSYFVGCRKVIEYPPSPVVSLAQGKLQGYIDSQGVWVYKGIHFAKPPVGNLRWAPPAPPDPWGDEVLKATGYAPMCVQVDMTGSDYSRTTGDEDCLKLNIWTTSVSPDSKLPVLVFIHGGAHMSGSSSGSEATGYAWYIGSNLAKQGPAVVVTIAYRVGVLGFIGHPALSQKSGYGGSGNYGHMDQIRALEWVRDNIAQFGGDPKKVMVFGQSGGASSTLVLLTSPRARGLFQSAIIHSMAAFTFPLADAESKGKLVENKLGCASEDPEKVLACMRSKSPHDVTTSISNDLAMGSSGVIFGPNVDGFVLPDTMMKLVRSGKQNQVPVIVGSTTDEFTTIAALMLPHEVKTEEEYTNAIASYFSAISSTVSPTAIQAAYPSTAYPSRKEAITALAGDYVYTCPARMLTRALASTHQVPVRRFLYAHTFKSTGWDQYRAAHGFELLCLFGPLPKELWLTFDESETKLSSQMMRAWTNFANSGLPDGSGFDWPLYDAKLDNYLILDTPPRSSNEFRKTQCDFWDQYQASLYP